MTRHIFAGLAALASLVFAASPAPAQVNAEVLRPSPLKPGWSFGLDGSVALSRGNIELFDVGGAARVQYQTLHPAPRAASAAPPFFAQRVLLTGSGRFAERAGDAFISQAFVHMRWTVMWHPRVGTDAFAQLQYNEFLHLQSRTVAGLGVRVEALHHPLLMIWGGSGYMFERDRILVAPGAPDREVTLDHRSTHYLTVRLALFDGKLLLQDTVYVQPRFDAPKDLRLLEELEALAKVGEVLALGATMSVLYDSAPPTGVKNTDLRLVSAVRVSF